MRCRSQLAAAVAAASSTVSAKLVTVLFVFFGFMGMGVALGRIVEYFIELEEVFRRRAAARLMAETDAGDLKIILHEEVENRTLMMKLIT